MGKILSTGHFQQFDKEDSGVAEMNITEVKVISIFFKKMNVLVSSFDLIFISHSGFT